MSSDPTVPAGESPDSGMATGTGEGTPGERAAVAPDDEVAAAVQDDAPLPASGEDPGEGELAPDFREP